MTYTLFHLERNGCSARHSNNGAQLDVMQSRTLCSPTTCSKILRTQNALCPGNWCRLGMRKFALRRKSFLRARQGKP